MSTQNAVTKRVDQKIGDFLEAHADKLKKALPQHCSVDRISRIAVQAISGDKNLQKCTVPSLFRSVIEASLLGLEIGGTLGHAYLVPYKTTCTFIIGYKGLINLAMNSGIAKMAAHVVHQNDRFHYELGLNPTLSHTPAFGQERGAIIGVYATYETVDGIRDFEVMTVEEVDAIRKKSPGRNSGPWKDYYGEMARKTVIRRLCKRIPLNVHRSDPNQGREFRAAVAMDNAAAVGERADVSDAIDVEAIQVIDKVEEANNNAESAAPTLPEGEEQA